MAGKKKYFTLDAFLENTQHQTRRVVKSTQSGIKKTGYLLTDIAEVLYYSYIEPVVTLKTFTDKEYNKQRHLYKQTLQGKFAEKGYSRPVSKFLSHIAPMPIAEESKDTFAYFIGAFVVGGFQKWVLDAFAHALDLDENKIIRASIVGEYFNNIVSSVQIAVLFKTGTFMEEYLGYFGKWALDYFPNFLKDLSYSEIAIYTGAYAIARYAFTIGRHEIYKKTGRYTTSPMRYITPSTFHLAGIATGLTLANNIKKSEVVQRISKSTHTL